MQFWPKKPWNQNGIGFIALHKNFAIWYDKISEKEILQIVQFLSYENAIFKHWLVYDQQCNVKVNFDPSAMNASSI